VNGQPMIGNIAWAPLPAFEEVEAFDRFNGVPTLGVFGNPGDRTLFWRAWGYVPKHDMSIWLYVPLTEPEERRLESAEPTELLQGLIFDCPAARRITVGLANDYRLTFEFEWVMPARVSSASELMPRLADLILAELTDYWGHRQAHAQKRAIRDASEMAKELAAC
jgi:hypothetical protein